MNKVTLAALVALGAVAAIAVKLSKAGEEPAGEGVKATAISFEPGQIPAGKREYPFDITATVENYSPEPIAEEVYITANHNIIHTVGCTLPGYGTKDIVINKLLLVDDEVCAYTGMQAEEEGLPIT